MNTTENNKLIAEFMGIESFKDSLASLNDGKINISKDVYEQAKYHTSWDWLMPVVEKIESIIFDENNSFNVTIGSTIYCVIQDSNGECYDMTYDGEKTKLLVVYKAIVEFIKWYNENK